MLRMFTRVLSSGLCLTLRSSHEDCPRKERREPCEALSFWREASRRLGKWSYVWFPPSTRFVGDGRSGRHRVFEHALPRCWASKTVLRSKRFAEWPRYPTRESGTDCLLR